MTEKFLNRWIGLAASLIMALSAGSVYAFGEFSEAVKSELGYKQTQLNLVGSLGSFGMYTVFFAGLYYDSHTARKTAIFGSAMVFVGYFFMWLFTTKALPSTTLVMGLFYGLALHGSSWLQTASTATAIKNFPAENRGQVVGLTKGFFGLCSSVISQLYVAFFRPDAVKFLFFLSIFLPTLGIFCLLFLDHMPIALKNSPVKPPGFLPWNSITIFMGVSLATINILQSSYSQNELLINFGTTIVLGCLSLVIFLPLIGKYGPIFVKPSRLSFHETVTTSNPIFSVLKSERKPSEDSNDEDSIKLALPRLRDMEWHVTVKTAEFWLLFVAFACGSGCGLTIIHNISQITLSLHGPPDDGNIPSNTTLAINTIHSGEFAGFAGRVLDQDASTYKDSLISLIATFNLLGRVIGGLFSDKLSYRFPRPMFLIFFLICMSISQAIFSMVDYDTLFIAVSIVGFSYGGIFAVTATLVVDLFGAKYFGSNYGMADLAPFVGDLILSTGVAGWVYEANIEKDATDNKCYGQKCYYVTFLVLCSVSTCGIIFAYILLNQTRHLFCLYKPGQGEGFTNVVDEEDQPSDNSYGTAYK